MLKVRESAPLKGKESDEEDELDSIKFQNSISNHGQIDLPNYVKHYY